MSHLRGAAHPPQKNWVNQTWVCVGQQRQDLPRLLAGVMHNTDPVGFMQRKETEREKGGETKKERNGLMEVCVGGRGNNKARQDKIDKKLR